MRSWQSGRMRRPAKALVLRDPKVRILPSALADLNSVLQYEILAIRRRSMGSALWTCGRVDYGGGLENR